MGFLEKLEHWRTREVPSGILCDIYNGAVWENFIKFNGRPFLSEPHHLALMLNCNWFQLYNQTQYSIGVIYLVVLNLPRDIRFKPENIIIAGIIPGPSEPKHHEMNSYLRPLVKELNALWTLNALWFRIKSRTANYKIFAALLGTVVTYQPHKKCVDLLGMDLIYVAANAKKFPYNKGLTFLGLIWVHQEITKDALNAKTKTEQNKIELENGCRFTEPYYDCIRYTIIDPMHNLLLGTAKRIL